ncbi:hypothetical protein [Okeania sp. KiyG1]|uniref:ParB N-terminal domain-containing protein n=1 Tax=Okeania sp. KiyG1 TaxID=2720165 RepID=UPI0019222334|nr:hypothetical protein [Okeania sp. KiyG1]GGA28510.1 hypothetical protein CYANOKiyG1_44770 [Okeania sp. KiyG1]
MLLSPEFVLVKEITSNVPRSEFSESDLEQAAQLILKAEGTIKPLVVRTIGWESYEVVDGHFEYYAAVRAKEINPRDGERIGAFIIEGDKAEALEEQVEIFRKKSSISPVSEESTVIQEGTINLSELDKLLDKKLQPIITKLGQKTIESPTHSQPIENKNIEEKLENIESKIDQLVPKTKSGEIEEILNNQLEVIRQKISNLSKQEALSLLTKTQIALNRQLEAIKNESNQLQKVNLLTVETKEDIQQAFARVKGTTTMINATWEAIKHWKQSGENLTWENLKKQTKKGIGFGKTTYEKLRKIAYIPE